MPALEEHCYLKDLEEPVLYDAAADEMYVLDRETFERIGRLGAGGGPDPEAEGLLRGEGLLQDGDRTTPVVHPGRSPVPSLRYLEIQVTGRCDKACRHCYLGPASAVDMSLAELESILTQFAEMQGLKVMISGGEPRCWPLLDRALDLLEDQPFRRVLITHGERIDRGEARRLGQVFSQVQVSLDGWGAGHDILRGAGSFDLVRKGIEALRAEGVPLAVGTMVHSANLDDFKAMERYLRDLGVSEWSVDVPCPAGRFEDDLLADPGVLRSMSERIRYGYGGGYHGGSGGLGCGSHLMTVFPDGQAAKCGFFHADILGRAGEDLRAAWARLKHHRLEELACRSCLELEACAGGCRYRAEVLEGDPLAVDVVQCYARGMK